MSLFRLMWRKRLIRNLEEDKMSRNLRIQLKDGDVVIQLLEDVAPKHVERVVALANDGAYDNVSFHRVIDGFMAQTGDVKNGNMEKNYNPGAAGTGGSEHPNLEAEFGKTPFERGTVGMARSMDPNSANSQFFIMFEPAPHLNGQYTVWGQVTEGMKYVDNITKGEPPANPDRMIKVTVEES